MVSDYTIVTASDNTYFHFVQGLILSIREKKEGRDVSISFLDLGCSSEQLQWLENMSTHVKKADWNIQFPTQVPKPNHIKAQAAKPFLRTYFPNHNVYIWMDADTWIQDWEAVELYLQGAKQSEIAITPEMHRSFKGYYEYGTGYQWLSWKVYEECFDSQQAEKYQRYPIINSGVFAMRKDSKLWDLWAAQLTLSLQKTQHLCTEQTTLNHVIYGFDYDQLLENVEFLPVTCNWPCHQGLPLFDSERGLLVEPFLPYEKLNIIHRSGDTIKEKGQEDISTLNGKTIKMNLQYKEGKYNIESSTDVFEFTP